MLPLPANSIAVPPVPMMVPASKMLTGVRALDLDAGRAGDHAEIGDAAGEGRSGDVDRGLAGENLARAVDQDAVARRLDGAAVDDAAGHRGSSKTPMPSFPVIVPELTIPPESMPI